MVVPSLNLLFGLEIRNKTAENKSLGKVMTSYAELQQAAVADGQVGNNNRQQKLCSCAFTSPTSDEGTPALWRPLVHGNVFEQFSTPQNRPLIWLVVATLGRSTSQNCCNWQAAPKLQSITLFFGRYGPRRLRLQLSVPTKLIETNKHKKTAVKQRSELLNYLLQHADFVSSGCSATRRKFLSATQQK